MTAMWHSVDRERPNVRRNARPRRPAIVKAFVLVSALAAISLGVARAAPQSKQGVVYTFSNCTGPRGTPQTFDAVKGGRGVAFHVVGYPDFVIVSATDSTTGTTLFKTPGFSQNGLPTITCESTSPVTGKPALVTGFFAA